MVKSETDRLTTLPTPTVSDALDRPRIPGANTGKARGGRGTAARR
jgi:hypothetical protein